MTRREVHADLKARIRKPDVYAPMETGFAFRNERDARPLAVIVANESSIDRCFSDLFVLVPRPAIGMSDKAGKVRFPV